MNEFQAAVVLAALFALRCVVPLLLMLAMAYGMNRLVARWEREEQARATEQRSIPLNMPAQPARPAARPKLPCWVVNNCDERTRNACPAYANPSLSCWLARLRADGALPAKCAGCPLYLGVFAAGD